jgi:hypothetical protein
LATAQVKFTSLFDAMLTTMRARYKRNTRGLLTWLVKRGPNPGASVKSLTLKEVERLATTVLEKLRFIPDHVHFYSREAIADRKKMTAYYREEIDVSIDDPKTAGHGYFTATNIKTSASAIPS